MKLHIRCREPGCHKIRWHNSDFCAMHQRRYECDVCGAKVPRDEIATVIAYGIETGACLDCRNVREN